ncbi:MFS transporter [Lentilactobacillus kosonis]|uniref:Cyanate MFS transporter n=1 Tax=Lentilactobacillus kosonis TaxID=2810561 RepID=A0A401FLR3_9LACO|nr:MFS transporter [Lentilactobacillus kosonis]GAY73310.1 cyanate MFS transporter [Lentilactobacillus kosonis]
MSNSRKGINFTFMIFMLAANLRLTITGLPPLVSTIQASLKLSNGQMGVLTTIPLLCFAGLSILVSRIIDRIGTSMTLKIALLLLAVANILRVYTTWSLFAGTILVGTAISMLNVLMPTLIIEWHPEQSAKLNGIYTSSLSLLSAVAGAISVPIANALGWRFTIQLFSIPAIIAVICWLFVGENPNQQIKRLKTDNLSKQPRTKHWKKPEIWFLAGFMGMQSFVFYTLVAWVPSVLTASGISAATAGILFGVFQLTGVPFAYFVPRATESHAKLIMVMTLQLIGYILGIGMLAFVGSNVALQVIACAIIGITTSASFSLSLTMISVISDTPQDAGAIGGLVQAIGYVLASVGPTLFGIIEGALNGWTTTMMILMAISVVTIIIGFAMIRSVKHRVA